MKCLALLSAFLASASAAAVQPHRVSYNGYKVFRVSVEESNIGHINDVVDRLNLQTWKPAKKAGSFADIVVHPDQLEAFQQETQDLKPVVMHEDLGLSIEAETSSQNFAIDAVNSTWFNSYHAYADHLQWLRDLSAQFPNTSEIVTSGNSLNGNPITGIHFWGSSGKGKKPAVILHGTVHAREWITTLVVEYFAYTLLTSTDATTKGFLDKYDFYFFPVVNVDGFLYTQSTDRLWRKNRQTNSGSSCVGRDINRNWNYMWNVPGGASTNPCAEDYKGAAAGDSVEFKALSAFIQKIKTAQGVKLYIDYHSYSQLFMTPYGYSCTAVAPNNSELQSLAKGAVAAIRAVHGTSFEYGPICSTIYQATGSSVDYVSDVIKADYTFTSELRDTGRYGFVLPADQILPSGEEAYAGFKYLLQNMK
ncbi:hypothetical protein MKX07_006998 [Trichoderma sp. CBMAI-0711]|uniref:Zinc carboxypeptidase n=1 Tax=Trichoderma parareesei TaxID=858221 RepID=A0A2H2ZQT2_TRIPA|nr:hypothetical protein MKX07_006998 [Trichoderma sp. CBMAI-0711]OTA05530.1 Zinc carboxypeptidase [Trichoderma parareesei]